MRPWKVSIQRAQAAQAGEEMPMAARGGGLRLLWLCRYEMMLHSGCGAQCWGGV